MPTELNDQSKEKLEKILDFEEEALNRAEELNDLGNFDDAKPTFEKVFNFCKELKNSDKSLYPNQVLANVQTYLNNFENRLSQVIDFDVSNKGNPGQEWQNIIRDLEKKYNEAYQETIPFFAYSQIKNTEVADLTEEIESYKKEIQETVNEVESYAQTAKESLGEAGVSKFAEVFGGIANEHEKHSEKWLKSTICLSIGIFVLLFVLFLGIPWTGNFLQLDLSTADLVFRVGFLGLLSWGLIWSAKNYSNHRHLTVVNRHRQNALKTFETFVESADDQETKNAVLLAATESIFSPSETGYIKSESTPQQNRFIEIIKSISSSEG